MRLQDKTREQLIEIAKDPQASVERRTVALELLHELECLFVQSFGVCVKLE